MAYTDPAFNGENNDLILNQAKAYYEICDKSLSNRKYEEAKKNYVRAVKALDRYRFEDLQIHHIDDIRMIREIFYPVEQICDATNGDKDKMYRFYIDKIFEIASCFITFRDGRVSIRYTGDSENDDIFSSFRTMNKIELWNTMSRIIPSDLFIAAHYINSGISSEKDMRDYFINVPTIVDMCDVPAKNIFSKGIAETHMHMNAGVSYLYKWKFSTNLKYNHYTKNSDADQDIFNGVFRFIFAEFLEKKGGHTFQKYIEKQSKNSKIAKVIIDSARCKEITSYANIGFVDEIQKIYNYNTTDISVDLLEETVYQDYQTTGTDAELIFLYNSLTYFKLSVIGQNDFYAQKLFMKYIRNKSKFFSDKLQSNRVRGIEYFRKFYSNANRIMGDMRIAMKLEMSREVDIFREQCKNPYLEKLEMKKFPDARLADDEKTIQDKILRDVYKMLKAYVYYIEKFRPKNLNNIPSIGMVYHLHKILDPDNFNKRTCIVTQNKKFDSNNKDYYSLRKFYKKYLKILNKTLIEYPYLSKYVVGLDAASSENEMEPWVLAPIFRNARRRKTTRPINPENNRYIANLGLTYHVGEEFRHILSGLRHVDEVIEHFGLMSGDRLGHAVALGIDVKRLVGINKIVCMPIMEHLENLLWIWGVAHDSDLGINTGNIEFQILSLAKTIYQEDFYNLNIFILREAYEKKFADITDQAHKNITKYCEELDENECENIEHFCMISKLKSHRNSTSEFQWDSDKLMCTHFCPCYFKIYNRPIFVEITEADIQMIEKLQRMLIKKVENTGVYVETNPTSNTAVTDIDGIMSHPILRLNTPELGNENESNVLVTINSDDPNVFSTNVENELALIYHSLLYYGFSREKSLRWIDKIREHGLNSSFIKTKQTVEEIEGDLEKIKRILKI